MVGVTAYSLLRAAYCVLLVASAPLFAQLQAGAAKRTITPDLEKHGPVYMAGFGHNRVATSIHDDLWARCFAVGTERMPLVMCGVDSIGLFREDVNRIRELVKKQSGKDADVVVAALHDHEAPDTMGLWGPAADKSGINEAYNTYVIERTAEAAVEAIKSLAPATFFLAKAHPPVLDTFINDTRPPVVHDAEVIVFSAVAEDGARIATLVNWANHPETLASKNTAITADYSGYLRDQLEKRLGGIAVFINGAVGGMQSPLNTKIEGVAEATFEKARYIGEHVADVAGDAILAASPAPLTGFRFAETEIRIPVTNQGFNLAAKASLYKGRKPTVADKTVTPVGLVRLRNGDDTLLTIALIPGELYPELSVGGVERYSGADFPDAPIEPAIKLSMSSPYRMLFGLADDEIGYIIPKAEWDEKEPWLNGAAKRWYGEVNSVGPDAAPLIAKAFMDLLKENR
jgi:hypothetical protein